MKIENSKLERKYLKEKPPQKMMREFERSHNFISTDKVIATMKDTFNITFINSSLF